MKLKIKSKKLSKIKCLINSLEHDFVLKWDFLRHSKFWVTMLMG